MDASEPLLSRLGMRYPIIQAPMAGVSTPALAAAVSNAGGLGSLGIGASTVEQAQRMISQTRSLTDRAFNVNVFCHAPARREPAEEARWLAHLAPLFERYGAVAPTELREIYRSFVEDDEALEMLLRERPPVVSFHFGLPPQAAIDAIRDAGIVTLATATTVAEARAIEAAGVDAVVAQGIEAGGHRGVFDPCAADEALSTHVLVRLLVGNTRLPIIAAGGIMDGAGVRAALDLGAVAAQLGTAFILCPESSASAAYRAQLRSEDAASTRLTSAISGRPARGMVNGLINHGAAPLVPAPCSYPVAYDAAKQLHAVASATGDHGCAAHWAGQGAPLASEMPARLLVEWLGAGAKHNAPT